MIKKGILSRLSRQDKAELLQRFRMMDKDVLKKVQAIISNVRKNGDDALLAYARKYDKIDLDSIRVPEHEILNAKKSVPKSTMESLKVCAKNITAYHDMQIPRSFTTTQKGITTGRRIVPFDSIGVYVPGGRAAYPSSVLMGCIPARLAGVKRIAICTPYRKDRELIFAAAEICGVKEVYSIGGAQAVAALAIGTKSVSRVQKIIGPGNVWVCAAKSLLSGVVGIDFIAGPSEILIISDDTGNPSYIASDMLAQCEHDPEALSVLVTTSKDIANKTELELRRQAKTLGLGSGIRCWILLAQDLRRCISFANDFAPEHLEIMSRQPRKILSEVKACPSVFLGPCTPTALGDYCSGTNHVLPTMGLAQHTSGLKVEDFVRYVQWQQASDTGIIEIGPHASRIARAEGLMAHAESVERRLKKQM